jgi:hypothetical protein
MTTSAETAQMLDRLRIAVNADHHRRWHHRRVGAAVAASLLVVTGVAVAAVTQTPWWQSGSPPVDPQAVASVARDNLPASVDTARARTVAQDGSAALVAVPLDKTGYCLIPTLGGHGDLGAQCEYQVRHPQAGDDDRLESYAEPAGRPGGPAWIVYGRVTDPRAVTVDLGAFTVSLKTGGFFVAEIAQDRWSALDGQANEGRILDASGTTLRSGCVNWGPSPANTDAGRTDTSLWLDANSPCKPQIVPVLATVDYSHARKIFEVTLTADHSIWKAGTTIAFWQAPASNGTQCIFPGTTSQPDSGLAFNPPGGADCRDPSAPWPNRQGPFWPGLGAGRIHVNGNPVYAHTTQGRIDPASGITRLALQSPSGTTPVGFADDYFFAQIPGTSASADTLPAGGPFTLIGYDSSGVEVASVSLNELQAKFQPHR